MIGDGEFRDVDFSETDTIRSVHRIASDGRSHADDDPPEPR